MRSLLILSPPLGAVDTFFGRDIASWLEQSAFADLATNEAVHIVLDFVDLLNTGDL